MDYMDSINELRSIVKFSEDLFKDSNIETKSASYVTMMGLFCSFIEHSSAFLILMESKLFFSTQSVARAALEVYIDILNLKKNGNYANYLWAEYYNREKEIVKSNSRKKHFKAKRDECYKNYKMEGDFELIAISQKFNMADCKSIYKSAYSLLSAHTHSGVFSLLNRVTESKEITPLSQQELFKGKASVTEVLAISLLSNFLLDTCEIIAREKDEKTIKFINRQRDILSSRYS